MASEQELDLEHGLPVTPADIVALRRLKTEVPSWLLLDWRELRALIPYERRRARALANDRWQPFSLD